MESNFNEITVNIKEKYIMIDVVVVSLQTSKLPLAFSHAELIIIDSYESFTCLSFKKED